MMMEKLPVSWRKLRVAGCELRAKNMRRFSPRIHSQLATDNSQLRPAFSLLEIMVAITVIAILAAIAVVAYKGVIGGNQANQTKATLGTLRGMLTEYENATHFQTAPTQWEWAGSDGSTNGVIEEPDYYNNKHPVPNTWPAVDFWRTPHVNASAVNYFVADPLVAPPQVGTGSTVQDRYGSVAVINTQIAMNLLASLPVNRAVIQNTSNKVTDLLQWYNPTGIPTSTIPGNDEITNGTTAPYVPVATLPPGFDFGVCWNSGAIGTKDYVTGSSGAISVTETKFRVGYVVGVQVADKTASPTTYWQFINAVNTNPYLVRNAQITGVKTTNWAPISAATPLFLDAWGNPIIFVPASGLLVRSSVNKAHPNAYDQADPDTVLLIQSPDKKPFWASAGPDGDFSSGDDNIYSFEQ